MAKRKPIEGEETIPNEPQDAVPANQPPGSSVHPSEADAPPKTKWLPRFGSFGDYEAGVRLIEDRPNRRMMIQFEEKPSDAVRAVLKDKAHGYRFDSEDQVWYKPINPDKPRQCRQEAEELALKVANMIREEKGLPQREANNLSV